MENSMKKYLLSVGMGVAGIVSFGGGMILLDKGKDELKDVVYNDDSDKYDVAIAGIKYNKKVVAGFGLGLLGGTLIGSSIVTAFSAGEDYGTSAYDAPVVITSNTLEDAQKQLDMFKIAAKEVISNE